MSSKTIEWLLKEIQTWSKEGIISLEQANCLENRYRNQYLLQQKSKPDYLTIILSIIGAFLIGTGVILFFAYNWDDIPKIVRTGMIIVTMISAYMGGYYLQEKVQAYRHLGEALIFLGVMLFGSGIFLIAQMYNINEHYPNGWLYWSIGAIVISYVARAVSINMLASVLLVIWTCTESLGFSHLNLWYFPMIAVGIAPFIYQRKSRNALLVGLISLLIGFYGSSCGWWNEYIWLPQYINLGALLILAGLWHYQRNPEDTFAPVYFLFGSGLLILFLFIASFYDVHHYSFSNYAKGFSKPTIWVLTGELIFGFVLILANWRKLFSSGLLKDHWLYKICLIFPAIILISAWVTPFLFKWFSGEISAILIAVFWNIICVTLAFAFLYTGQKFHKISLIYAGTLVFLLLATGRYFDLFDSLLHRSIYFLIAGGLFVYYSFWLSKKRKLIQSAKKGELS